MRRFRFRLEPLLRLRSQFERSARRDLAVAMVDANAIDQRLAAAAQGLRDCGEQAKETGAVGLLARSLEMGLRRHQWRLRTDQQKAQKKLDVVRADYVVKARDMRALQRLRDQRQTEWRTAAMKAEQAALDELAQSGRASARRSPDVEGRQA